MSKESNVSSGGLGLCGALFLVLLTLKLLGKLTISWWWVTAPLWGGTALFIAGFIVFLFVMGMIAIANSGPKR